MSDTIEPVTRAHRSTNSDRHQHVSAVPIDAKGNETSHFQEVLSDLDLKLAAGPSCVEQVTVVTFMPCIPVRANLNWLVTEKRVHYAAVRGCLIKGGIGDPMYMSSLSDRSAEGSPGEAGLVDRVPRPKRRTFPAQYKLAIVEEYEQTPNGQKGVVLRREGMHSSHVIEWTRARDAGPVCRNRRRCRQSTAATESVKRRSAPERENEGLHRKYAKLEAEHAKTQVAPEIAGKHLLLETISERADTDRRPKKSRVRRSLNCGRSPGCWCGPRGR